MESNAPPSSGDHESQPCSWCGAAVAPDEGFRLAEPAGARRAAFCRLEHVAPWVMQGPRWAPGEIRERAAVADSRQRCAHCAAPLTDTHLALVRHRGEHRIPDWFCSVDHLGAWARAGGRWRY